jgi:hypothetical protein
MDWTTGVLDTRPVLRAVLDTAIAIPSNRVSSSVVSSEAQIESVSAWPTWLEVVEPDALSSNTYERVQDMLTLLKERRGSG